MALDDFFREIDSSLRISTKSKARLRIIGSSALMLQTDYARGTKDSDVLHTNDISEEMKARLLALAGQGTTLHVKHGIYIEFVSSGLPFLPQVPLYHSQSKLNGSLRYLDIEVLDVVDVVVSKLKRFNANDRSDILAMVERDLVPRERLLSRFRDAVDFYLGDSRAADLANYIDNLHTVERDFLGTDESAIELPDWLDR